MKRLILIAAALLGCAAMQAKITLPSVISDNMVLQQNTEASLWGTADPGAKVTIKTGWSKQKTVVTADAVINLARGDKAVLYDDYYIYTILLCFKYFVHNRFVFNCSQI